MEAQLAQVHSSSPVLCFQWPPRPGEELEDRGAGFRLQEGLLPSASFDQLTSNFVVPRGFSPRWSWSTGQGGLTPGEVRTTSWILLVSALRYLYPPCVLP